MTDDLQALRSRIAVLEHADEKLRRELDEVAHLGVDNAFLLENNALLRRELRELVPGSDSTRNLRQRSRPMTLSHAQSGSATLPSMVAVSTKHGTMERTFVKIHVERRKLVKDGVVIEWSRTQELYESDTGVLARKVIAAIVAAAMLEGIAVEVSHRIGHGERPYVDQYVWLVDRRNPTALRCEGEVCS